MAISKTMEDAVQEKDAAKMHSAFYTILLSDPGFISDRFEEAFSYVKGKEIDGFIQPHDGGVFEDESKWDHTYWDKIASELMDNFSLERIEHLKQVSRKIYPLVREEKERAAEKKTESVQQSTCRQKPDVGKLIALTVGAVIVLIIVFVLIH